MPFRRLETKRRRGYTAPPLFQRFTVSRTRAVGSAAFFRRRLRQSTSRITIAKAAIAAAIHSCRTAAFPETTVTVPLPVMVKQR